MHIVLYCTKRYYSIPKLLFIPIIIIIIAQSHSFLPTSFSQNPIFKLLITSIHLYLGLCFFSFSLFSISIHSKLGYKTNYFLSINVCMGVSLIVILLCQLVEIGRRIPQKVTKGKIRDVCIGYFLFSFLLEIKNGNGNVFSWISVFHFQ